MMMLAYSFLNNINLKKNNHSIWYTKIDEYRDYLIDDVKIKKEIMKFTYKTEGYQITNFRVDIFTIKQNKQVSLIVWYNKSNRKLHHDAVLKSLKNFVNTIKPKIAIKKITIDAIQDSKPMTNGLYIAQEVSREMKSRISVRKLNNIAKKIISEGIIGCIIEIKGRINGHGISRKDKVAIGAVSRNTLINNVEFQRYTHVGQSGCVGIKVWINKGQLAKK